MNPTNSQKKDHEKRGPEDQFYSVHKKGYYSRIPLIKPYELISSDDGFTWSFIAPNNEKTDKKLVLQYISHVGIQDSIIVMYTKMTSLPGEMSQAWCLIDAEEQIEKVFTNEVEYENYIKEHNKPDIQLLDVKTVYDRFKNRGELLIEQ